MGRHLKNLEINFKSSFFYAMLLLAFGIGCLQPQLTNAGEIKRVHAIAMHGEPKYQSGFKHFDYVNPTAPKGGAMSQGSLGSFDSLNGFIIKGEAADGLGVIYDTLMTASADEAFSRYGLLAHSIEMPEDRTWITFFLRPEARWHDGQPITADDVVWSFETLVKKGPPFFRFYYADVEKVEAIDKLTVKFTFKPVGNRELPLTVSEMPILPKHYWQGREFEKTTLEPPLGSGPYKIGKFEPGRFVEYERVEDYWGKDLNVNIGHNNVDTFRYEYFRDGSVAVEAFKGGAFDFRSENISKIWATGYDIPAVKNGLIIKEKITHHNTAPIQGFVYNLRNEMFSDARVRQALAYAFDFEWSNRNLFYDQYKRARSYFGNSELEAKGLPMGDELAILEKYRGRIPNEVFKTEYNPPATRGDGRIRDNLKIADELLKQAGWEIVDGKRVHTKTGRELNFELMLVSPAFERISLPFAKNLERLGVFMRVRTVDSAQYLKRLETHDFEMISMIWGQSLSPGNEQRNYWGSGAAQENGSRNHMGISDPVVDELIEGLVQAPDREQLIARTRALDRVLQWGHYLVPHWYADYDRVLYWNKFSRPDVELPYGFRISTWWYDEAKAKATNSGISGLKPQ
ncbi:MAG: extracellular solute-binding protein [Rhodospirillaceae bacterium]|nr:extracellular solute-binding protein [Rhodospirillaceae bacterium]